MVKLSLHKRMRIIPYILTALLLSVSGQSLGREMTDTRTRIINPGFRTMKLQVADNFMSPPVIRLGSDDLLSLKFDEMGDDWSSLRYRFIHCNSDWQPSSLLESEYVDGFNEGKIEDYAFSDNTFVHFVNYSLLFPTEEVPLTASGNYVIQVYDEDNPDETLLQARFQVVEPLVDVEGKSTSRTDRGFNTEWQQLSLKVSPGDYRIGNPYSDLKVIVNQNGDEYDSRTLSAPLRVEGTDLIYERDRGLIFLAGNEYRRFETVRNNYPGMHVDSTRYYGLNYHAYLTPDQSRVDREYVYDQTQFGRFLIREYNATDSDLGADYITVHFQLDFPELIGADIYVDGELTHGINDERNRMKYDRDTGVYTLEIPLKQGSYNYRYVVKSRNGKEPPTASPVEGNKYETRNEYRVAVWHRPPGSRADRLIGYTVL